MKAPLSTVPTYSESIRIGWSILWRGTGSFVLLLSLGNIVMSAVLPEFEHGVPSLWATLLPLGIVTCVATFGIMPYLVRALFTGSYSSFRLQLFRNVHAGMDDKTPSYESSTVTIQH